MGKRNAFTLAEMMIVMLILTILLAAFAPLMTKKNKVDLSNPWRWASNNSDIYYGMGNTQTAMIGQNNKAATDPNAKLLINQSDTSNPLISFKYPDTGSGGMPITRLLNLRTGGLNLSLSSNGTGGQYNTGFGFSSLGLNMTGDSNTAMGYTTLSHNTSGHDNVAIGKGALFTNTTGYDNVAVGVNALYSNLNNVENTTPNEASDNTAVGSHTLYKNTTGYHNVAVGSSALFENTTGHDNIAIGSNSAASITNGYNNIAIGSQALYSATGSNNIAIGQNACKNITTGSNKICIGSDSGPTSIDTTKDTDNKYIYLGDEDTVVFVPGHLVVDKYAILGKAGNYATFYRFGKNNGVADAQASYSLSTLHSTGAFSLSAYYDRIDEWTAPPEPFPTIPGGVLYVSDKRLKNVVSENTAGLEQIKKLKIFNYTFKKDEKKIHRVGVIAQDLQKIFPDAVTKGDDGFFMIRMEDMFYASINAIKELDKMLQDLVAQVKTIATQVKEHDTQIKAIQKENKELKAKVQNLEKRLDAIEKKL